MLYETAAQQHVWTLLAEVATDADRDAAVERTIAAYLATGVTGVVDMAFDELGLAAFDRAAERRGGTLPIRVLAHWFVANTGDDEQNLAQVARAVELAGEHRPWLKVAGIKLVLDGVIDACTAAMRHPYGDGSNAEPIWPLERLRPVVAAADAAGLQVAMHAIGDLASDVALDALEHAHAVNGERPRAPPHRAPRVRRARDRRPHGRARRHGVDAARARRPGDLGELGGDARRRACRPRLRVDRVPRRGRAAGVLDGCPDRAARGAAEPVHRGDPPFGARRLVPCEPSRVRGAAGRRGRPRHTRRRRELPRGARARPASRRASPPTSRCSTGTRSPRAPTCCSRRAWCARWWRGIRCTRPRCGPRHPSAEAWRTPAPASQGAPHWRRRSAPPF